MIISFWKFSIFGHLNHSSHQWFNNQFNCMLRSMLCNIITQTLTHILLHNAQVNETYTYVKVTNKNLRQCMIILKTAVL